MIGLRVALEGEVVRGGAVAENEDAGEDGRVSSREAEHGWKAVPDDAAS